MQRYFLNEPYVAKKEYELTGAHYHHVVNVMRMSKTEQLFLVFSNKMSIVAEITGIDQEWVHLAEIAKENQTKELPVHVTIACGYPKGDKLDWIVQKTTELGVSRIFGFPAQQSVVKWDQKKLLKKEERLMRIATEAAEQSQRQVIPQITLLQEKEALITTFDQFDHVLVAYEEAAKEGEQNLLATTLRKVSSGSNLLVIFGPEGGFSPEEIKHFELCGGTCCGLGPRILRTETAPLYVLSAISYQSELGGNEGEYTEL